MPSTNFTTVNCVPLYPKKSTKQSNENGALILPTKASILYSAEGHFIFMEFDRDYKIPSMQIYNRMETRLDVISVRVGDAGGEHVIFEKGDLKDLNPIEVRLGETPIRSIRITILANTINGRLRESADIGEIVFPGFHVKLLQSKV